MWAMRIGLIINGRLRSLSGAHLYDAQLVNWLYQEGDDVEVISLPEASFSKALANNLNRSFYENLRRADFDLLLQDAHTYPSLFWLNQSLRSEIPYPIVTLVHAVPSETERRPWVRIARRQMERSYFGAVDAFVCSSRLARMAVEKLMTDGQERPSMVAYPGGDRFHAAISEHEIVSRAQAPGPLRLLFVGDAKQHPALFNLVTALAYLSPDLWRLDVVSNAAVAWRTPLAGVDVRSNITFCGAPTEEAMVEIYRRNQVAVIPDEEGIFDTTTVEAMGFGLAVVGAASGAGVEVIRHGRHGLNLAPNNSLEMARHLALLVQNRRLLLRLGLEAHKRSQTHATWAESMGAVREFLAELVKRSRSFAPVHREEPE
jgi:glycosyltransferase involved in cell wall biosynthesis